MLPKEKWGAGGVRRHWGTGSQNQQIFTTASPKCGRSLKDLWVLFCIQCKALSEGVLFVCFLINYLFSEWTQTWQTDEGLVGGANWERFWWLIDRTREFPSLPFSQVTVFF